MNWAKFKNDGIGMRVELEPPACNVLSDGRDAPRIQPDDWIVDSFPRADVVRLSNIATGHIAELGKDHIYDFRSNPMRSKGGLRFGFLVLKVQIFVEGVNLRLRPNRAPGESVLATDRIAELEREAAALRSAVRPRRLTKAQQEIIVSALRGKSFEIWLGTMRHDTEAQGLWHDIDWALRAAGLKVVANTIWEAAEGVSITPGGGVHRDAVKAAFAAAGIELWDANGDGARLERLEIIVGSKQPPTI